MSFTNKLLKYIPSDRSFNDLSVSNSMDSLAVVIHTCDKYSFCWEGWNYYFQKYWNFSENCNVYFFNEEQTIDYQNIIHRPTGFGEWSDRLVQGLKSIPENNVLYLQEDFWLTDGIDIFKYFQIFKSQNMNVLRLCHYSDYYYLYKKFCINTLPFHRFSKTSKYLISHQASIWNKEFFLSCLPENENPWINEVNGTKRLKEMNEPLNIFLSPLDWYNATCRGGKLTDEGMVMLSKANII